MTAAPSANAKPTMGSDIASITAGFANPVDDAQRTFRCVLDAMSRPGRIVTLPEAVLQGIEPPRLQPPETAALGIATTAVLLTLLDAETSVSLNGTLSGEMPRRYLRFHTGVRDIHSSDATSPRGSRQAAAFNVWRSDDVPSPLWSLLDAGTDEAPQRGATLVIEVAHLHGVASRAADLHLRVNGPGIESEQSLAVAGLDRSFWKERADLLAMLPRGIDLLLVCGAQLAALPRSTRVALEP
ncbi:phosphonate C-P lyase system protein PhnH [soil metagenome]